MSVRGVELPHTAIHMLHWYRWRRHLLPSRATTKFYFFIFLSVVVKSLSTEKDN